MDMLRQSIRQTIHLKNKDGYILSGSLLRNILRFKIVYLITSQIYKKPTFTILDFI